MRFRQRRRLGELLGTLDDEQWATASRCEGWSVRDVIAHLVGTDQFWALSASAGLAGAPTRYLDGFNPVATPARVALARHALWDAWVHERDVRLPRGVAPVEEPDEVLACLQYVAGLGPAFLAAGRSGAPY